MSEDSKKRPLVFRINDHGQGPDLVKQVFLERGWHEYDEDTQHESDWNIWWRTSRFRVSDYENIFPWQRLNHYPKSTGITKKDCLVRNLRRMKGVHGAGVYNFSPLSFNLPNDYTRYIGEYGKIKAKMDAKLFSWICKPADMSRGRGIFVFRDISELQYDCNAVVQQYISNPLLIGGYKFDIRLYVAVPSFHPLTIYLYQEGIVRFSTEKYDLSALNNVFSHLTNTSINKHGPQYQADKERVGPGCKWTLTQLRYYLHQNNYDDRLVWARIVNIIILTLLIQAPQVPKERNCYELYGFDILIDETLKPWLLEVNFSPALSTDMQVDVQVKKPMLHDLMDMLNFKDVDSDRGGVDKRMATGRLTARGRMSANKNKAEPIDRNMSSSRLSQRGGIQRMSSTISSMMKSIEPPVLEPTLSFIQQDNPSLPGKNQEKLCFGLPLVNPSDDEHNDSDFGGSRRSSIKSESDVQELLKTSERMKAYDMGSKAGHNFISRDKSFERSGTMSSIVRKPESLKSARGEKGSLKSFSNSDSAYSSFSDNSDKVSSLGKGKSLSQGTRGFSLQSEVLSEVKKESTVIQIKSLRPTQNSNSLRKVSNRGRAAPVIATFRSQSQLKSSDRQPQRSQTDRAPSRLLNNRSKIGGLSSRSDADMQRNRSQTVMSNMSTVSKNTKDKDLLHLGLSGISKKPTLNEKPKPRSKSISVHNRSSKGPPPKIGDFFLVFPFNEGTYKAAHGTLDPHVVIKETQRWLKDLKGSVERTRQEAGIGGLLPYGAAHDAERLWAPVKAPVEES